MSNLPRLELTEDKSNLKNNDYIIFRHESKGNKKGIKSKKNVSKKHITKKRKRHEKKTHKKSRKGFFSIFT